MFFALVIILTRKNLTRLWKVVQEQSSRPSLKVAKEKVCRYSDVILPRGCKGASVNVVAMADPGF